MSRKPASPVTEAAPESKGPSAIPRITKKLPRESDFERTAKDRNLAGVYRVITSNVVVPRPESEWRGEDGKHKPGEPTLEMAQPGDELYLGNEDALRLLSDNIVEELDSKPSRVNKVFTPPKVAHNLNAAPGETPRQNSLPGGARI